MRVLAVSVALLALVATAAASPEAVRRPAPALGGTALDGKTVSLTALRGKPVFINVWSSW